MTSIFERVAEDLHIHHPQAAAPAPAATAQENRVSKLTEAATAIAALAGNKLVEALVETDTGKLLTPGEVTFVTGLIASFEHQRATAPQQVVQQPTPVQPAPTGPQHSVMGAPAPTT